MLIRETDIKVIVFKLSYNILYILTLFSHFQLYSRLVAVVDSPDFHSKLESLHEESLNAKGGSFPFREASGSFDGICFMSLTDFIIFFLGINLH